MNQPAIHDFGLVDDKGDAFEFTIESAGEGLCRLVAVVQTERGPRRTEVAAIPASIWRTCAVTAVRELASEMGEAERDKKKPPTLQPGLNRLSPLVGRELGVLLMALMEEGAVERADALLSAWRELAREERWWLYSKAAAPGQRPGAGWRRALFHALSETSDTRSAPADEAQKKSSGNIVKRSSKKQVSRVSSARACQPIASGLRPQARRHNPKAKKAGVKASPAKRPKTTAR
jgi:hypothetical protein